jgi:hypothetical protein
MALIRRHVSWVRTIHEQRIGQAQKENGGQPFKKLKSAKRQEILCDVSRTFTVDAFLKSLPSYARESRDADITEIEEFTHGELARLLASCAYIEDLTKPLEPNNKKSRYAGTRMPVRVSLDTLRVLMLSYFVVERRLQHALRHQGVGTASVQACRSQPLRRRLRAA